MLIGELLDAFAADAGVQGRTPTRCCRRCSRCTREMSPDTYGGAVLLGVDGVCIISHGSSSATAMLNGITVGRARWSTRGLVDELPPPSRGRWRRSRVDGG